MQSREPKGRSLLLVGLACVLATAWTEGASPGALSTLFVWIGCAVIGLVAVSFTIGAIWLILVNVFGPDDLRDDAYEADSVRRERDQ